MTERYRSRDFTERPDEIVTPQDRGRALKNYLDVQQISVKAFAVAAGISRAALNNYLAGSTDLAYISQSRAGGIITAMGITDWEAWEVLGIPDDAKETFRTFRPHPEGHGQPVDSMIELRLTQPLIGEVPLPSGTLICIDPAAKDRPIQIVRLPDGRLYSVSVTLFQEAVGEQLGGLISAHF